MHVKILEKNFIFVCSCSYLFTFLLSSVLSTHSLKINSLFCLTHAVDEVLGF